MILVSACLLGQQVRYKGDGHLLPLLQPYLESGCLLPFCPECAGGLPTPRPPAEIQGGSGQDVLSNKARVINDRGADVTAQFIAGAQACLKICQKQHITAAILKERSPSCGTTAIYDGSFSGLRIPGQGVTAALLQQAGIPLYSEEQLTEELLLKLLALDTK